MQCSNKGRGCEELFLTNLRKSTKKKPIPINDQIQSMKHDLPMAMKVYAEPPKTDCCTHRTSLGCIQLIFEKDSVKPLVLCQCVFNSTPHTLIALFTLSNTTWTVCIVGSFPTQMCPFPANSSWRRGHYKSHKNFTPQKKLTVSAV